MFQELLVFVIAADLAAVCLAASVVHGHGKPWMESLRLLSDLPDPFSLCFIGQQ